MDLPAKNLDERNGLSMVCCDQTTTHGLWGPREIEDEVSAKGRRRLLEKSPPKPTICQEVTRQESVKTGWPPDGTEAGPSA
jgi:hypothetical protein